MENKPELEKVEVKTDEEINDCLGCWYKENKEDCPNDSEGQRLCQDFTHPFNEEKHFIWKQVKK